MNRVGVVSYSFQYSIGLFTYQDSPGEKLDAAKFVVKTREAGGEVAQIFHSMVDSLSEDELARVRRAGEEHDVMIEVHGGGAQRPTFEDTMRRAKAMGVKVVGCSFGMMMRPDKVATLEVWDQHLAECKARYAALLTVAATRGRLSGPMGEPGSCSAVNWMSSTPSRRMLTAMASSQGPRKVKAAKSWSTRPSKRSACMKWARVAGRTARPALFQYPAVASSAMAT